MPHALVVDATLREASSGERAVPRPMLANAVASGLESRRVTPHAPMIASGLESRRVMPHAPTAAETEPATCRPLTPTLLNPDG